LSPIVAAADQATAAEALLGERAGTGARTVRPDEKAFARAQAGGLHPRLVGSGGGTKDDRRRAERAAQAVAAKNARDLALQARRESEGGSGQATPVEDVDESELVEGESGIGGGSLRPIGAPAVAAVEQPPASQVVVTPEKAPATSRIAQKQAEAKAKAAASQSDDKAASQRVVGKPLPEYPGPAESVNGKDRKGPQDISTVDLWGMVQAHLESLEKFDAANNVDGVLSAEHLTASRGRRGGLVRGYHEFLKRTNSEGLAGWNRDLPTFKDEIGAHVDILNKMTAAETALKQQQDKNDKDASEAADRRSP
jgi:hypothetical protein